MSLGAWPKCACSLRTRSSSRAEILHQADHLALDQMRLLAHRASFSIDCITWIDSISSDGETMTTRARCARCTIVFEILVDLGEDRFRRHEHEGGVLRLARRSGISPRSP